MGAAVRMGRPRPHPLADGAIRRATGPKVGNKCDTSHTTPRELGNSNFVESRALQEAQGGLAVDPSAAMVSLYYHAHRKSREYPESPPDELLPMAFRPAKLADAAIALQEADDEHAESRRLRAITQLTKSPLFNEQSGREALEILGAPVKALQERTEAESELADIHNVVWEVMEASRTPNLHETRNPTLQVGFDPRTLVTDITVSVQVKRDFGEVVKTLDPRTWARCSDYFEATYLAETVDGLAQIDEHY